MPPKNPLQPKKRDAKRLAIIAFFIVFLFSLLVAQFYKIQIVEGDKWTKIANRQHYFIIHEPFLRGRFISNTSIQRAHPEIEQAFVVDILKFHFHADPDSIPQHHHEEISKTLLSLLNLSDEEKLHFR
jgi:cell division protein FtsI (penicillin-binding protein 3)